MAHAATISELSGLLVTSIIGASQKSPAHAALRDQTVKRLREHNHARTNQFEVRERYAGLVEKFSVLNRDDLSEALKERLEALPSGSKWMPEFLAFFLSLSDRPVEKTNLADVETPVRDTAPSPDLTWAHILAEEPHGEDDVWDSVQRGYHSSGDDRSIDGEIQTQSTESTEASSLDDEDLTALARLHIVTPQESALDQVRSAQKVVNHVRNKTPRVLSEITMIRETLTMLRGLPTNLYSARHGARTISVDTHYALATASKPLLIDVLHRFANIANGLDVLREWSASVQAAIVTQALQSATQHTLARLASRFEKLEQNFVQPEVNTVVSIMKVFDDVRSLAEPVLCLSRHISAMKAIKRHSPIALLESLYDAACEAQLSSNRCSFDLLAEVFLAGYTVYLRPLHEWALTGTLPTRETSVFFVRANDSTDHALGRFWEDRFALRQDTRENDYVPFFMAEYTDQLFTIGKTRAFSAKLDGEVPAQQSDTASLPVFSQALSDHVSDPFMPFSQILANEMDVWVGSLVQNDRYLLRHQLLNEHGFSRSLQALAFIYFAKDGDTFQTFADAVIMHVEARRTSKPDIFTLTGLVQDIIGASSSVSAGNLSIKHAQQQEKRDSLPSVQSIIQRLRELQVDYAFTWPSQNITHCTTSHMHSQALLFLLQIYRARSLLCSELFTLRMMSEETKAINAPPNEPRLALKLRQRLLWFTNVMHAYITSTASSLHSTMRMEMETADGIDNMSAIWERYIQQLSISLLLSDKLIPIRDAVTSVLSTCESFAEYWKHTLDSGDTSLMCRYGESSGSPQDDTYPAAMLHKTDASLSFICSGLRSIGRAGGDAALEALADSLDWATFSPD